MYRLPILEEDRRHLNRITVRPRLPRDRVHLHREGVLVHLAVAVEVTEAVTEAAMAADPAGEKARAIRILGGPLLYAEPIGARPRGFGLKDVS